LIDDNAAPTPNPGVDFSSLSPSPTPEQYFLLSRLDGKLTVGELCKISGMGRQRTLEALEALARSGVIDLPGFTPPTNPSDAASSSAGADSSVTETAQARPSNKKRANKKDRADKGAKPSRSSRSSKKSSKKKRVEPNYPIPLEQFEFDERLLGQDVVLDDAHRRELICLHAQMSQMTFYDIFGLDSDASKKDIK
jgi:hypothetical protein